MHLFLTMVLAFSRFGRYLKEHPNEKESGSQYQHEERNALTFVGFSLTALALLVGLQFNKTIPLSPAIQFFSLAFALILLSVIFMRFRTVNATVYLSDVFLNSGLLSIACGFLVFFAVNISFNDASTIIFSILFIALVIASGVNYIFFDKYARRWNSDKKTSNSTSNHSNTKENKT